MANLLLINDIKSPVREAWVGTMEEFEEASSNYSWWAIVRELGDITEQEAERIRQEYVNYVGEPDKIFTCCETGCRMTAREYAYMQGFVPACEYDDDWDE